MSSVMPPTVGSAAPDGAAGIPNLAPSDGHAGKHLVVVAMSLFLAVASMVLICGQQGEAATAGGEVATCGGGSIYLSAKERETFKRHNAIRGRQDLPRFCLHPALQKAARHHSEDMVKRDYFSHDTMGRNEDFSERIESFGYTSYSTLAENIAYGSGSDGSPSRIMRAWMRSDGHRRNILDPRLRQIGIGVFVGNWKGREGTSMYTADFGARQR
ncbi:MAG TPA: CAP domain-containing protein [Rubrobacter sp.]|nr:CAP domain-containing protein [Rubrobacter sp.]